MDKQKSQENFVLKCAGLNSIILPVLQKAQNKKLILIDYQMNLELC